MKRLHWLFIIFFASAFFIIFSVPQKTSADSVCDLEHKVSLTVESKQTVDGIPKVMPGETIKTYVKNDCDKSTLLVRVYVHPKTVVPNSSNVEKYVKIPATVIPPINNPGLEIPIDGSGGEGDYIVRAVVKEADTSGDPILGGGQWIFSKPIKIATEGVTLSQDSPKSVVQAVGGTFNFTIYGHAGGKFSLYVDSVDPGKIKESNIPINSNVFSHSYTWETAGTDLGSHQLIVVLENGHQIPFSVEVTKEENGGGGNGGGGGKTFPITKLNGFNLKVLLNNCKANDLNSVTCLVNTIITWLLDIGSVIAFIMMLYASIIYLTSYGDESKAELAKKTLIWSVIGVIVIGAAMGIMSIIHNTLIDPSSLK